MGCCKLELPVSGCPSFGVVVSRLDSGGMGCLGESVITVSAAVGESSKRDGCIDVEIAPSSGLSLFGETVPVATLGLDGSGVVTCSRAEPTAAHGEATDSTWLIDGSGAGASPATGVG